MQAVQYVDELHVEPGQRLLLSAKHDTYSISYSLDDNEESLLASLSTGVPAKVGRALSCQACGSSGLRRWREGRWSPC